MEPSSTEEENFPMVSKINFEESVILPQRLLSDYGPKQRQLGEGTYGTVTMHESPKYGKVAIKSMKYDEEGIHSSTLREISALVRMRHPNIISVIDVIVNTSKSKIHMVMSLAKLDLLEFIKGGKHVLMPLKQTSEETDKFVAYQIVCGINYCLTKGILNRDIKPSNILITEDGTVKIADFGLARASMCSFDSGATNEVYTLWYRPPEILLGGKYRDPADIWATGCTLYELYTGYALFPGKNETDMLMKIGYEFGKLDVLWPEVVNMPNWQNSLSLNSRSSRASLIKDLDAKDMILGMLTINPSTRTRLQTVVSNVYFDSVRVPNREDRKVYSCVQILEQRSQTPVSSIPKQTEIKQNMLIILFDWLVEVSKMFKLNKYTFFLAQILLDKYMAVKQIKKAELQLYGCAALNNAAKMIEVFAMTIDDLVFMSDKAYTRLQMTNACADLVDTLGFDLIYSTSMDFKSTFERSSNYDSRTKLLSTSLLKLLTIEPGFYYKYTPREMALGCLFVACTYLGCTFRYTAHLTPIITEFSQQFVAYKLPVNVGRSRLFKKEFETLTVYPGDHFVDIQLKVGDLSTKVL